jgi:hypothetical protein
MLKAKIALATALVLSSGVAALAASDQSEDRGGYVIEGSMVGVIPSIIRTSLATGMPRSPRRRHSRTIQRRLTGAKATCRRSGDRDRPVRRSSLAAGLHPDARWLGKAQRAITLRSDA